MKILLKHLILALLALQVTSLLLAQDKHPRVAEVETHLTDRAFSFLRGRFPNKPIIVNVTIDPLRRTSQPFESNRQQVELPFGMVADVTITDEWDDPSKSITQLLFRIRQANVTVRLSNDVSDDEINLLRNDLFAYLKLIPARDRIEFERKEWTQEKIDLYLYLAMAAGLFILLMTFFVIIRTSANKIAASFQQGGEGKSSGGGGGQRRAPAMSPMLAKAASESATVKASRGQQEINFNDRISLRNDMRLLIRRLNKQKCFPALSDMIELDNLADNEPETLGAILMEFSLSDQEKLFGLSPENRWLNAFASSGTLDTRCYDILEKISRLNRDDMQQEWENLLIYVWRLGVPTIANLCRRIDRNEAMSILDALPLDIAIPVAREAFPGAWGVLLDSGQNYQPLFDPEDIKRLTDLALELLPKNQFDMIDGYRRQRNLIDYVRVSNVTVEKEIYEASGDSAIIRTMRPPFYVLLNEPLETLVELFSQFTLEDWALALFDISREQRNKIKQAMTEKQWFLFVEILKKLDKERPEKEEVGDARDRIAFALAAMKNDSSNATPEGDSSEPKVEVRQAEDASDEGDGAQGGEAA